MRLFLNMFIGLGLLSFFSGCGAAGVVTYKIFGPPPVEAKFTLSKVPTLILVEDYRNPTANQFDADSLQRAIAEKIVLQKLAPLVEEDELYALRDINPKAFRALPVEDIGKRCKAQQVIYVDFLGLNVEASDSKQTVSAAAITRVKIVAVKDGATLWPTESNAGYPVNLNIPHKTIRDDVNENTVRQEALTGTADRIVKLFYKHAPDDNLPTGSHIQQ